MDALNPICLVADTRAGRLYTAESVAGGKVFLKRTREADRDSEARLRHEARLFAEQYSGSIASLAPGFARQDTDHATVLCHFDGVSLAEYLRDARRSLATSLKTALGIAKGLADLHAHGICHNDVHPRNLLVQPESGAVLFVDCSAYFSQGQAADRPPAPADADSLPYRAPESFQGNPVLADERADLYGLGVILYQLATGRLPLSATDLIEWRHVHLARTPLSPSVVDPAIPHGVSDIIMALLRKLPDERYQSAAGLREDLQRVIDQLTRGMPVDMPALHRTLALDKFAIPERLYGRELCIADLDAALNRVIATGTNAVTVVTGDPGSGKTALMRHFRECRANDAYFGTAKFDPYSRRSPYRAVSSAIASWIHALQRKEESEIEAVRARLCTALGPNGQLVTSLVPSLEALIGPQPNVPEMPPARACSRFRIVWRNFLRSIASGPLPLVLIFDDLQWADQAGLELLDDLYEASESAAILIVVAFNTEDEPHAPAIKRLLSARDPTSHGIQRFKLRSLDLESVRQLLRDVVRRDDQQTVQLAQRLLHATGGNPLATRIALEQLHETGNLWFDHTERRWQWNDAAIGAPASSACAVEASCNRLRSLDSAAGYVVSCAAFLADESSISMLSCLCQQSQASTGDALGKAARLGIVAVSQDSYRFLQERYRQAALQLLPEIEHTDLHLRLAHLYPVDTDTDPDCMFEALYHFNLAFHSRAESAADIERMSRLNLVAAQRAQRANAYSEASQYYFHALRLIDVETWQTQHEHALATSLAFAECMCLAGRAPEATAILDRIEDQLLTDADRARVFHLRVGLHEMSGRYDLALRSAMQALSQVGAEFPTSAAQVQKELEKEHATLMARLAQLDFEAFASHPGFADETPNVTIGLMAESLLPAYLVDLPLFCLIVLRGVNALLDAPSLPGAPPFLSSTGYYLAKVAGATRLAGQFSDLSVRLSRKPSEVQWLGEMLLLHADHVNPRLHHISTDFPYLEEGLQWCLETGDLVWMGVACFIYPFQAFAKGDALEDVLKLVDRFAAQAKGIGNEPVHQTVLLEGQAVKCLLGRTDSPTSFSDDRFSESDAIRAVGPPFSNPAYLHYHVMKQVACFLAGDLEEAWQSAIKVHAYLPQLHGFPIEVVHTLFYALTLISLVRSGDHPSHHEQFHQKVGELVERVAAWAEDCPLNWRHVERLLRAELAQNASDDMTSQQLYEEAVADARRGGFTQNEALANELAAEFCMRHGLRKAAGMYANEAVACYARWGAVAKVMRLRAAWGDVLQPAAAPQRTPLDALALSRATQAISSEIALDRLLDTAIRVVLQTTAAQAAQILAYENDAYRVMATGRIEGESISVSLFPSAAQNESWTQEALDLVRRARKHFLLRYDHSDDGGIKAKSVLYYPLRRKSSLLGVVYLEYFDTPDAFDEAMLPVMDVICSQIAISLENARLYASLANEVALKSSAEQKVSYGSSHDALTGLPNRTMCIQHLGNFIRHARQGADNCAVLVVHIAGLKEINDTFGRTTGDRLLSLVCERLQQCYQDEGMLARIGDNEFAAMIPFLHSEGEPAHVAQRFLDVLALPFTVESHQLHVEACIGISLFPADGRGAEPLLSSAETALYFARQRGHGAYRFFESALNDTVQRRLAAENTLRTAFAGNTLRLYYQPQVQLDSSRIYSAEALLRLEPADQPAVSCGPLLHAVQETSLILAIGEWTIRQACDDLKQWQALGFSDMRVAVNLSPRQFFRPNFKAWLVSVLEEQAINPATLNLEITEGTLMEHSAENCELLDSLHGMGIQLSIDDFGTGYSSLSYLQRFPIHELKIDQAFIRGIHQNDADKALVSAITAMGKSLHLDVLAEGVETQLQADFLRSVGCAFAQGYLYGKAVPAHAFSELLMANPAISREHLLEKSDRRHL